MTIDQDIRAWALTRPAWQQNVLVALSRGDVYDVPGVIAELADHLRQPNNNRPNAAAQNLMLGATEPKQVVLKSVCNLRSVNALAADQTLRLLLMASRSSTATTAAESPATPASLRRWSARHSSLYCQTYTEMMRNETRPPRSSTSSRTRPTPRNSR